MELEFKPDIDQCLKRFEAWWHCEIVDRPPVTLNVKSSKPRKAVPAKTWPSMRDKWMDMEYHLDAAEAWMASKEFIGESMPAWFPNLGPELCATPFGAQLEFGEHTSWSKPMFHSCRDILKAKPDLNTVYWQTCRKATEMSIQRGKGKWITGLPDFHFDGDLLAALRDPAELCMEMADDLEGVRLACEHVSGFYETMFDDFYNLIAKAGMPSTSWTPYAHMGRAYITQCDFICMISPDMFRQTILPALAKENAYLERAIFHLDGPGALKHLDDLMAHGNINGVQWVFGASNGPARKWIDVYKRIQAAGKCMQILCDDFQDAKAIAEQIRPQGAWMQIGGDYSHDEAKAVLDWAGKWAAGKA